MANPFQPYGGEWYEEWFDTGETHSGKPVFLRQVAIAAGAPAITIDTHTGNLTDGSGTITTGGDSQEVFAANPDRKYLLVQNQSEDILFIEFGGAAVEDQPSIEMLPKMVLIWESMFVPGQSVNIIGPNTGAAFAARQG